MNKTVIVLVCLVFSFCFSQVVIQQISTDIRITTDCTAQVSQTWTFNFNGVSVNNIRFPIQKSALYAYDSKSPSDYMNNVFVSSPNITVTSARAEDPGTENPDAAYLIFVSFNPNSQPLNVVTFYATFGIKGLVTQTSDGKLNIVRFSFKPRSSPINDYSVRFHLSDKLALNDSSITADPLNYLVSSSASLVEFKNKFPLPVGEELLTSIQFPLKVDGCFIKPLTWWQIMLIVIACIVILIVCIPICCICGCISRILRGPAGYVNMGGSSWGYSRPYHNHHYHHGSSSSGYGTVKNNNSGVTFTV